MGALDTWAGSGHCPRCGAEHFLHDQTLFFKPEYGGAFEFSGRHFARWEKNPLSFAPEELQRARVWDERWWRLREAGEPGAVVLFDALHRCTCGAELAVLLRFRLEAGDEGAAGAATLTELALLDALAPELASAVDFVNIELSIPAPDDHELFEKEAQALGAAPFPERAARLHAELRRRSAPMGRPEVGDTGGLTLVTGPVRCEDCGTERQRTLQVGRRFAESLLGPDWRGGVLSVGKHVDGDFGWLVEDVDRGECLRLRHPLPPGGLTVIGRPQRWSCGCAAGWASPVLGFRVDAQGVTLDSLRIRAVRTREALDGVDFSESPNFSRPSPHQGYQRRGRGARLDSRDEALAALVWEWRSGG